MPRGPGHTPYVGHTWRLCPYSQAYHDKYYINGEKGNSTDSYIRANAPSINVTEHTTTDGTMVTANSVGVWGFRCTDDNCYYYQTYGKRHFES